MRIFAPFCLLLLVGAAVGGYLRNGHRAPKPARPEFRTLSPRERIAAVKDPKRVGYLYMAYKEANEKSPDDPEILRGRIRNGFLLGAVAEGQPGLGDLVREEAHLYLDHRKQIDPDGSFLHDVLDAWVNERLKLNEHTPMGFFGRLAVAMQLAACGDERGTKELFAFAKKGPVFTHFFPLVRTYLPGWKGVEPLCRYYLEAYDNKKYKMDARVQAGTVLLEYHQLFGAGDDLYRRDLATVQRALRERASDLPSPPPGPGVQASCEQALLGLAMLGDPADRAFLARLKFEDVGIYAPVLRVARVWAGIDPFEKYDMQSANWTLLPDYVQMLYFRAAGYCYVSARKAGRAKEASKLLGLVEAALGVPGNTPLRLYAFEVLARCSDQYPDLPRKVARGLGVPSLYAALLLPDKADKLSYLLPGVSSPMAEYASLAAVHCLYLR